MGFESEEPQKLEGDQQGQPVFIEKDSIAGIVFGL